MKHICDKELARVEIVIENDRNIYNREIRYLSRYTIRGDKPQSVYHAQMLSDRSIRAGQSIPLLSKIDPPHLPGKMTRDVALMNVSLRRHHRDNMPAPLVPTQEIDELDGASRSFQLCTALFHQARGTPYAEICIERLGIKPSICTGQTKNARHEFSKYRASLFVVSFIHKRVVVYVIPLLILSDTNAPGLNMNFGE